MASFQASIDANRAQIDALQAASEEATLDALTRGFLKFAVASSGVVIGAELWFRQGSELLRPCIAEDSNPPLFP